MDILAALANDPSVAPAFQAAIKPHNIPDERLQYEQALRRHDWSHEFSDDGLVARAGRDELRALREMQRRLDPGFALWNVWCHPACRDGRAYA